MLPAPDEEQRDFDPKSSCAAAYAHRMRRYRERDGLSQSEVGAACTVSGKLISAIENLRRLPNEDVSVKLDRLYETAYFEEQYWHVIREAGLSLTFRSFSEQESQADSIRMYAPERVPGLFQIEPYARHVLGATDRGDALDREVAHRLGRQEILRRADPPYVTALIKEAALREPVCSPEVPREQLAHLLEVMSMPTVTMQVLPTGALAYVASGFTLLGFAEGTPIGFVEGAEGLGRVIEPPASVHRLAVRFDVIRGEALTVGDSEKLISSIMEAL